MKIIQILLLCFLISGCHTISFHNAKGQSNLKYTKKHYNVVYGLAEVSKPIKIDEVCFNKNFSTIKTEQSFVDGLIEGFSNGLLNPMSVSYSCEE